MNQQRSEFDPELEAPVLHDARGGRALSSDHLDRLLAENVNAQPDSASNATPMAGIWLGVALGLAIWAAVAGVVLLLRAG
jgi:hypothetical protein